jgi:hypothetical protein
MTIQEFSKKLEDLWLTSKAQDKAVFKVGILLPWELIKQGREVQEHIPHLRVKVVESGAGTIIEVWGK